MKKLAVFSLTACLVMLSLAPYAASQITGGSISGNVRNQVNEPVANAKVTCTNTGTNQSRSTTTDAEGFYRLPSIAVGTYEITIESDTYQTAVQQVTLRVNEDAKADIEMQVAGTSEQAKVVGVFSPITETSTSVLGIVVENKQIVELPISGRNFLQLGTLVANVNSTPSLRSGAEGGARNGPFAVSGQRDRSLSFLVDGVDNTNSLSDNLSARISIDAIQEFKMITSLGSAEYGYHSGGLINIVTKSGTNDYHFTGFGFFRDDAFNAADYFEKAAGRETSQFLNNQFGGAFNGPIKKDQTFFLASYEGQRLRAGTPQFASVPTDAQRQGFFVNRATGQTVQIPIDPVSNEIMRQFIPASNVQTQFGNYFSAPITTGDNDFAAFRVDHLMSGDDVLNARYYIFNGKTFYAINPEGVRQTGGRPATIDGYALIEPTRTQNLAVAHTHNFSVQTVNDARFGYNRYYLDQVPQTQIKPAGVGFTGVQPGVGSILFAAPGVSAFGAIAYPIHSRFGNYHVSDSLSFIKGHHSLKTGGEVRIIRESLSHFEPGHTNLAFSGQVSRLSPFADFVLGVPAAVIVQSRPQAATMHQEVYGFFAQDDFQVNSRLVLNLGLRYELATVLNSPNHQLTNFSFERGLFTPGVDTDTGLYKGDHNNWAPRVGFAWTATKDGMTVVRGGYGVYFDNIVHTLASLMNRQNSQQTYTSIAPRGPGKLGGMLDPSKLVPTPLPSVAYEENLRTPYAQHFNLTLQREFGRSMIASVGYVGSRGTKLVSLRDINQAIYIPGLDSIGRPISTADGANVLARRPSQLFHLTPYPVGAVDYVGTSVSSSYHALQATFNRRLTRGLSMLGTYTWSKSIDDSSDPYGFTGDSGYPQDSNNVKAERALSIFDVRRQFTFACTYALPFNGKAWVTGWELGGILSLRSGQPFTPILGFDPTVTGRSFVRPNNVPGAITNKDGLLYLDRSLPVDPVTGVPLAMIPATGQVGNLGRNTFIGPGYKGVDLSVLKQTRLKEKLSLQARLEVFNLFNTSNLALPERRLMEPYFGLAARTQDVAGGVPGIGGGGPRGAQLALKLIY
ncbi:MAG TPA: TonB-dependent receptor [Blastocatellia bacterium]|nr:TonB-dependent receptor [Blastocatellia bacterium]